jgi:threonylcarbamoyladenosine tRNA methylthiotransferase MtaB
MNIEIVTFGCRLNTAESAMLRRQAQAAGLSDAVVVNTCAVTAEAVRQARQTIRGLKREQPGRRIVVTGCAAQVEPQTFAAMPEVDRVLGNTEKLDDKTWAETRALLDSGASTSSHARNAVSDIMAVREMAPQLADGVAGRARAFVQVQNGCDHRCTFCIIPFGRGNSRSLAMGAAVEQIQRLSESYREIVLTGVDLTSYGAHLPGTPRLGKLVKQILRHVPNLSRLRLSSIDSIEADRDLLDALATEARLMPHLHLSLQAGDDIILRRMKRRHLRADAIAFCAQVRRLRPDVVFGGDIIAGFPTETEEMFAHSLDLVDECGLTYLHVFPFSARPGTPAARMPQLARDVVRQRARRLRDKAQAVLRRHLEAQVGARRRVLTENGQLGRTEQFTKVRLPMPVAPGLVFEVGIAGHDGTQLLAA